MLKVKTVNETKERINWWLGNSCCSMLGGRNKESIDSWKINKNTDKRLNVLHKWLRKTQKTWK